MGYLGEYSYDSAYEDGFRQGCITMTNWILKLLNEYVEDESSPSVIYMVNYIQDKIHKEIKI